MQFCHLIRISSQAQDICPNVPLTGDVFCMIEFPDSKLKHDIVIIRIVKILFWLWGNLDFKPN